MQGLPLFFFLDIIPTISLFNNINKNINSEFTLYSIGLSISFLLLLFILILFTEPNLDEGNMLTQIFNISGIMEDDEEIKINEKKENAKEKETKLKSKSINDENDEIIFLSNNEEIEKKEDDEEESQKCNKVLSKEELQGLNSIEKDIILMNQANNFDDVNLVGNELERIKKKQINNNKDFRKSFLAFVVTLFLCNMINEYILIKTPFLLEKKAEINVEHCIIAVSFIILLVFSFPLIVFCRIIKKFNIERRLLLALYIMVLLIFIGIRIFNYIYPNYQKPIIGIIFIIYLLNNCLEGITHLLIEKIIPSFVKFCGINMKNIFSYSIHIGKAFGGIIFFLFYLFVYKIKKEQKFLDKFEVYFFLGVTFFFFIVSFICYRSLRVRAFAKLRYDD